MGGHFPVHRVVVLSLKNIWFNEGRSKAFTSVILFSGYPSLLTASSTVPVMEFTFTF